MINARHRKHFKAGCATAPGRNLVFDEGFRLTRSTRRMIDRFNYEDEEAEKVARQAEAQRRAEKREKLREQRTSPLPKPNFLKRCASFLQGLWAA